MEPGKTIVITKYESSTADTAFDEGGVLVAIPAQDYSIINTFAERGLTKRLTLQSNVRYLASQSDAGLVAGTATGDLGLRLTVYRRSPWVVSLYAGAVVMRSEPRAVLRQSDAELGAYETRILIGHDLTILNHHAFTEVQLARLSHQNKWDEYRLERLMGVDLTKTWQVLVQTYEGSSDAGAAWSKAELSIVRRLGTARVQLGWRQSVSGLQSARESGPVFAVWRSY